MRLTFIGHSCFLLETVSHRLLFDPFISENPAAAVPLADLACDFLLITHGHSDHVCDAAALAGRHGATIIANHEIAEYYGSQGLKVHGMGPGGGHPFPFGRVTLTPAIHTSSFDFTMPPVYAGCACGIVVEADGKRIYHAGDTALFGDMKLIARGGLDLAIIPIGDNYTMGPADALDALDLLQPKLAVPMHYDTWPLIAQDAAAFAVAAQPRGHQVKVLPPGASLTLS